MNTKKAKKNRIYGNDYRINLHAKGQALVEIVIAFPLFLILGLGIVEIFRVISSKVIMEGLAQEVVFQLTERELELTSIGFIDQVRDRRLMSENIQQQIQIDFSEQIEKVFISSPGILGLPKATGYSSELNLEKPRIKATINIDDRSTIPGVSISLYFCIPGFFRNYTRYLSAREVRDIDDKSIPRDCLGQFILGKNSTNESTIGIDWYKIHVSAHSPWMVNGDIFKKGFFIPKNISFIDPPFLDRINGAERNSETTKSFITKKIEESLEISIEEEGE